MAVLHDRLRSQIAYHQVHALIIIGTLKLPTLTVKTKFPEVSYALYKIG